jgi:hypothetical protein
VVCFLVGAACALLADAGDVAALLVHGCDRPAAAAAAAREYARCDTVSGSDRIRDAWQSSGMFHANSMPHATRSSGSKLLLPKSDLVSAQACMLGFLEVMQCLAPAGPGINRRCDVACTASGQVAACRACSIETAAHTQSLSATYNRCCCSPSSSGQHCQGT